jgi:predicted nucleotidyltransferase
MNRHRTCCVIKDDCESIFTPCVYIVESSNNADLRRLVSYRGRFTEQVTTGMSVSTGGRLERVVDTTTGDCFQQLVLGENSTDYLLPI